MAAVCPVIGATTSVLPPSHPALTNDPEARCPVTNAKVEHHQNSIHSHPSAPSVPGDASEARNATKCPALKNANNKETITDATCPVVGPVSAVLPPTHPALNEKEAGKICPVTNASLEHHKGQVHEHPGVPDDAAAQACPVAGQKFKA
ncbi:hypothetical protein CAC42_5222 [Sphaceloma murrayae]|uniref:Uncharacterized protein n=1 Tax=Sphaceloma murrayae TaxID=2082308 RepID=A0A2K1QUX7_9PEZI|nr:hypothetical protein CAC42_5222 [Sphaceloma murrayae]